MRRVDAKCEEDGFVDYVCSRCGDSYTEVLKATGHNFVDGKCTKCGKLEREDTGDNEKPGDNDNTDKDDDTTIKDDKLPQTGANIIIPVLATAFAASAAVSGAKMLKKEENE